MFVCFLQTSITISRYTKYTNLIRRNILNNLKTSTRIFIALDN